MDLSIFSFNKSFPIIFMNNPIGVIIKKKITTITNGDITFPNKIPNDTQERFKGFSTTGLVNDIIKNIADMTNAHILIFPP